MLTDMVKSMWKTPYISNQGINQTNCLNGNTIHRCTIIHCTHNLVIIKLVSTSSMCLKQVQKGPKQNALNWQKYSPWSRCSSQHSVLNLAAGLSSRSEWSTSVFGGLFLFSVLGKHSGRLQGWCPESACDGSTGRGTVYHANTKFPMITC